jgi:hypothetical protein
MTQRRARDFGFIEIPTYKTWSARKLEEGESDALIANLDARNMWLMPDEITTIDDEVFEELLDDLKTQLGE